MGGDGIGLRTYRPDDLEEIFRLDELCFTEEFRFDRDSLRLFAEARNACSVVAQGEDGSLLGFVIAHLKRGGEGMRAYILTIDVAEEQRGQGLARRMMNHIEQRVRIAGAKWVELHVFVENRGAITFYERVGYERQGRVWGFYGKGVDAWYYRKEMNSVK